MGPFPLRAEKRGRVKLGSCVLSVVNMVLIRWPY
uniref:Uncharacterized protein n=1 Tax=Rhizophora mucronata TaxID=61149 RepID=A0A2P2Q7N7_RHIMU